jgi:hypothetical protein
LSSNGTRNHYVFLRWIDIAVGVDRPMADRFDSCQVHQVLRVLARESHAVIGFFEGLDGVKQRGAQNPGKK